MNLKDAITAVTSKKVTKAKSLLDNGGDKVVNVSVNDKMLPFSDGDSPIDERRFEVDSTPAFPGFGDDLSSSSDFNLTTPKGNPTEVVLGSAGSAGSAGGGVTTKDLYTADRNKSFRDRLFQPARDSFSPTLNSLSTIGIDVLGEMDDTKMRAVLKKVLRSIKV